MNGPVVIHMRILQRGERTDRLLAGIATRLDRDKLAPSAEGLLPIRFVGENVTPAEAWVTVREALGGADPAWEDLVTIGRPPK
jgi:hypothetical protein